MCYIQKASVTQRYSFPSSTSGGNAWSLWVPFRPRVHIISQCPFVFQRIVWPVRIIGSNRPGLKQTHNKPSFTSLVIESKEIWANIWFRFCFFLSLFSTLLVLRHWLYLNKSGHMPALFEEMITEISLRWLQLQKVKILGV